MITARDCPECLALRHTLQEASRQSGIAVHLTELESDSAAALQLAIRHGLENVPSLVVAGQLAFEGTKHAAEEIARALREGQKLGLSQVKT
jgi:glutaredoxin